MCSLQFENNFLTIGHVRFRLENSYLAIERVRFASKIIFVLSNVKTPISKLLFAFVSLALPLLGPYGTRRPEEVGGMDRRQPSGLHPDPAYLWDD